LPSFGADDEGWTGTFGSSFCVMSSEDATVVASLRSNITAPIRCAKVSVPDRRSERQSPELRLSIGKNRMILVKIDAAMIAACAHLCLQQVWIQMTPGIMTY
jgi:hypothetical protein